MSEESHQDERGARRPDPLVLVVEKDEEDHRGQEIRDYRNIKEKSTHGAPQG